MSSTSQNYTPIKIWIIACILLVCFMVILGGYTRLTHSGLSIVEWNPVSGITPPLTENDWNLEFLKYKESPEFRKINNHINIDEFKEIFLVEYFHRLSGRITGLVFLLPFIFFFIKGKFNKTDIKHFSTILFLIALQGFIGWFMVKSGLKDQPNVSQYRLAIHLLMACILLIFLTIKLRDLYSITKYQLFTLLLLILQIASGAFVAGLKAGLIYNTFPLMNGQLIPEGLFFLKPWYINFFANITMVQFIHRILGIVNVINLIFYSVSLNNNYSKFLLLIVMCQFTLGVATLLLQVPLLLGLLHQATAIILLIVLIFSFRSNYTLKI